MEKPAKYTDAQWKVIEAAIKAEQEFEMSAAFGKGVEVVDITTGQRWITKQREGNKMSKTLNLTSQIIAFETGELDHDGIIELFQHLVDTGLAWSLQGHYGRTAAALIEAGLVTKGEN